MLYKFAYQISKVFGASEKILRVTYEHIGAFQVITKDFFHLNNISNSILFKDNFFNLYQGKEEDVIINQIAYSLYETFCALNIAPIIKVEENDDY